MAQFTLNWDNTAVLAHPNSTGQRASYRQKSVGGAWITVGFTPTNDLPKTATTTDSPNSLLTNVVYEFKIESLCTVGGPTINDNGIREAIEFACITPVTGVTETTSTITLDVTGLDITKARFTLRKASDNTIVYGPTTVNRIGDSIMLQAVGLTGSTNYYWQVELYATVNLIEVISSQVNYLGVVCSPYPITTDAPAICDPITSLSVSSIEIL